MLAADVCERIGAEAFDGLVRFCVEREPVAKCLSHSHMLKRTAATATATATAGQCADVSWSDYCHPENSP